MSTGGQWDILGFIPHQVSVISFPRLEMSISAGAPSPTAHLSNAGTATPENGALLLFVRGALALFSYPQGNVSNP